MGQDEGAGDREDVADDSPQPGPRRSTFTPAPADAVRQFFSETPTGGGPPAGAAPPAPSTAVTPPPGSALPRPPQRKSLPDTELLSTLDADDRLAGGALEAIEQLQEQLHIREQDAREFRNWESSMLAIGTPEALDAVEEVRTTFTEVIQVIPPAASAVGDPEQPAPAAPEQPDPGPQEPTVYDLVEPAEPLGTAGTGILLPESAADLVHDEADEHQVSEAGPPEPTENPSAEPGEVASIPDAVTTAPGAFSPESSGADPTRTEHRTGRPVRLFWLWFAANSSALSLIFGGLMLSLGMSLRQAIVAALAGVALSFLPIGLATLASKWNGQPTMVVSRASFGLAGNVVPAVLALVTRLLWGAALLWLFATVTAQLLGAAGAAGGLTAQQLSIASAGVGFLLALAIAFFGYRLLSLVQVVLSVLSGVLIIVLIAVSWPVVDLTVALTIGDGPWVLVLTGAILVFSFVGLAWATSAGDLARYQRPSSSGAGAMLTASFGSALPPFVLIVYGALVTASDPALAFGFVTDPAGSLASLASLVPAWFLVPLIAAVGAGLLSGVILSIYSGGFALLAVAPRFRREASVLAVGVVLGGIAVGMTLLSVDVMVVFRDLATTLAVPTAAWLGIFAAEVMIRNRRFETRSLVQGGGVYPNVNWVNLSMLVVASAVGYGLTTATVGWLGWQGYLLELTGIPLGSELARADLGVLAALAVALLTPIVAGVPTIRRQEAARG